MLTLKLYFGKWFFQNALFCLLKQNVLNIIWPFLDDSLWTSISVQCCNTALPSGTLEVLKALSPMQNGSRELCIYHSSVSPPCHLSLLCCFSVPWFPASHLLPSLCTHLLSEGLRVAPAIPKVQTQTWGQPVQPLRCHLCGALAQRNSGLLVSRSLLGSRRKFQVWWLRAKNTMTSVYWYIFDLGQEQA